MRVYRAFLEQDGSTNDPVVTVFENTLCGDITWTRGVAGEYDGVLVGAFPVNKTWSMAQVQPCEYNTEVMCSFQRNTTDSILLNVFENDGSTKVDGCKVYLEIIVY